MISTIHFFNSLVHIFRNSVVHGVEDIETRLKKGKPESGKITCSFSYADNLLRLKIADDGAGIDIDRVVKKAIDLGLYTPQ